MHCNRCNRLLIAADAKLVDAFDSEARLELSCECGAVHSAFIEDDAWIFGLAGDKTHGRILTREWCRLSSGVVRWLAVHDYNNCEFDAEPKDYMYRLPLNDPRPWGNEMTGMANADWLADLPFLQWRQIVCEPPSEI